MYVCVVVPEEHGALQLLQLGGGRVHPAHPVLRGPPEAGVSQPSHLVSKILYKSSLFSVFKFYTIFLSQFNFI